MEVEAAMEELKPRNYQVELMNLALKQNSILFLPTGAGKTFIAIMVLKKMGRALDKVYSEGGQLCIVSVNTVALVEQQANYIRTHSHFRVAGYTGDMNVDVWDNNSWNNEFEKYQVLVMTAQILVNIIASGFLPINKIKLIIFDECHHGISNHPMRHTMKLLENQPVQPHILGLTATLLNRNVKECRVRNEIEELETTFNSKIAAVNEMKHVIGFATQPEEQLKQFRPYLMSMLEHEAVNTFNKHIELLKKFKTTIKNNSVILKERTELQPLIVKTQNSDVINMLNDLIYHFTILGMYGSSIALKFAIIQMSALKRNCDNTLQFNVLTGIETSLLSYHKQFRDHMKSYKLEKDKMYNFSSHKILTLIKTIKNYKHLSQLPFCGLIFVQRRFTAKILYHILLELKQNDEALDFIKPNFVVRATSNIVSRETLYKSKVMKKILNEFCQKEINLLVATNLLEEGIDIPTCTFVLQFDLPQNFRSYVQSKGRCRHRQSLYNIMVPNDEWDIFNGKLREYNRIEDWLIRYLVGTYDERNDVNQEKVQDMYNDRLVEPFYSAIGARIDQNTAIPLLHRYCSMLQVDAYTSFHPEYYYETKEKMLIGTSLTLYKIFIELPITCPIVEPIEGIFAKSKLEAKQVAAYNACVALYKAKELDENMLPIKRSEDPLTEFLFTHWPEEQEKAVGFKKSVKCYHKKVPNASMGSILPNTNVYLHIIKFDAILNSLNMHFKVASELLNSHLTYGIVTTKPLDKICNFPLFLKADVINISFDLNCKILQLNEKEINQIRHFHNMVFNDILELVKTFTYLHRTEEQSSWLVAPVHREEQFIDFGVIEAYPTVYDQKREPTGEEKLKLVVNDETYLGKVVTPWYRRDDVPYIVTKVCHEINANTPFIRSDHPSYKHYFETRYNCQIVNPTQPLLLVKRITNKLNCFYPKISIGKTKREDMEDEFEVHFIPELCVKQDFPGCLWFQARLLPALFYRISHLLNLEELRKQMVSELNFGLLNPPVNPLKIDESAVIRGEEQMKKANVSIIDGEMRQLNINHVSTAEVVKRNVNERLLELQYPWENIDEPVDIERNLNVRLSDVEYYVDFINKKFDNVTEHMKCGSISINARGNLALTYNVTYAFNDIKLLRPRDVIGSPQLSDFYQAFTAVHCKDIVNYERLETLGDSFLKFISSVYIYLKFPTFDEGRATAVKGKLVSNANLYYLAVKLGIPSYINYWEFQPKTEWCPPGYCVPNTLRKSIHDNSISTTSLYLVDIPSDEQLSGVLSEGTKKQFDVESCDDLSDKSKLASLSHLVNNHYISDKVIADVVEAMLGAYFEAGGIHGASKFLEWVGVIPKSEEISEIFNRPISDPRINKSSTLENIDYHIPSWEIMEQKLGYHFKNRGFLLQALTHSSYTMNRITNCYQRLEFLGDAVLDFLITCYIYENCGKLSPGDLTDLRSALVNNITFACFTVREGFHKFLLSFNKDLDHCIEKFVNYQQLKDNAITDDVVMLLNEDDIQLGEGIDCPKALGDLFEALIGAVYLDSSMNLNAVWKVVYKIIWKEIDAFSKNIPKNAVRQLHEENVYPEYHKSYVVDQGKIMVQLDFMMKGVFNTVYGVGSNKKQAKSAAAKIALRLIK